MITVTFSDLRNEGRSFRATGHSGYAPKGEPDIICAAVTALCTGLIGTLQDIVKVKIKYIAAEGHIECKVQFKDCNEQQKSDCQLLFAGLELALRQISLSYGTDYLSVNTGL